MSRILTEYKQQELTFRNLLGAIIPAINYLKSENESFCYLYTFFDAN